MTPGESLLRALRRRPRAARALLALHERACVVRAYPRSASDLAAARAVLAWIGGRGGAARLAGELTGSGIAGTPIRDRFFWPIAHWLASRHPDRLEIDWEEPEFEDRLRAALPTLVTPAEGEALRRAELRPREALARLAGGRATDAAFLIRRIAALPGGDALRETVHDALDVAYLLRPGPAGPSRTFARLEAAPFALRHGPPERSRPDLATEIARPPRAVRALGRRAASRVLDLAREAMVTRARDLDAFSYGDVRDVRLVDDGDGLAFAVVGVVPERRLYLPAVYGALTLRNGVPIGYVQLDVLFGNAEVSYNTFETFRGGEAAFVFGRLLSAARHLFGVSCYSVEPYQLGRRNDEGLDSGAWWFYARSGFLPRDPGVLRLARAELARRAKDPRHRSDRATLERLASAHVFWTAAGQRRGVVAPIAAIGLRLAGRLAREAGADREAAVRASAERVARRLGVRSLRGWSAGERLWWRRWAPLLDAIPGLERWTPVERRATVRIARAKGGRRESEYARLLDAHPRLSDAILALARR